MQHAMVPGRALRQLVYCIIYIVRPFIKRNIKYSSLLETTPPQSFWSELQHHIESGSF